MHVKLQMSYHGTASSTAGQRVNGSGSIPACPRQRGQLGFENFWSPMWAVTRQWWAPSAHMPTEPQREMRDSDLNDSHWKLTVKLATAAWTRARPLA